MSATPHNRAAFLTERGSSTLSVSGAPLHEVGDDEVLIRTSHVGIGPLDFYMQKYGAFVKDYPAIVGTDVTGIAHKVGKSVAHVKVGDRVVGHLLGILTFAPRDGAFQLFSVCRSYAISVLPASISFQDAAVLPLGTTTAAMGLFGHRTLALPPPTLSPVEKHEVLLIWGGASSVGAMAIQLAKASGFAVATTCSPKNNDLMRDLGADHIFDYISSTVIEDIVKGLSGVVVIGAFDAAGAGRGVSCSLTGEVLARLVSSSPKMKRAVSTVAGPEETIKMPEGFTAVQAKAAHDLVDEGNKAFVAKFWPDFIGKALEKGLLRPMPAATLMELEGLEGIQSGIDRWSQGVSGEKVVVKIA